MGKYAENTTVSSDRSIAEIQRTLQRYDSEVGFGFMVDDGAGMVEFRTQGKRVRFVVPLPRRDERQFEWTPARRKRRTPKARLEAWETACRQRWRALALCIKANLEAVEAGIVRFEEAFMPHIVLPDGKTVGDHALPAIESAYQLGSVPMNLLPAWTGGDESEVVDAEIVE